MFGEMKELLKSLSFKKLIDVSKMLLDLQYRLKLFNEPYFAMLLEMLNLQRFLMYLTRVYQRKK